MRENHAPFHVILSRQNDVLLSFLNLRAIVNGKEIFPLANSSPVVIPVWENHPRLVITDAYHITRPLKLVYKDIPVYGFKIKCAVSDQELAMGFGLLVLMYLGGFFTGILILKVFSFIPLFYLLIFYYLNRKDFLKVVPILKNVPQ